jgi:hypothetical protein
MNDGTKGRRAEAMAVRALMAVDAQEGTDWLRAVERIGEVRATAQAAVEAQYLESLLQMVRSARSSAVTAADRRGGSNGLTEKLERADAALTGVRQ